MTNLSCMCMDMCAAAQETARKRPALKASVLSSALLAIPRGGRADPLVGRGARWRPGVDHPGAPCRGPPSMVPDGVNTGCATRPPRIPGPPAPFPQGHKGTVEAVAWHATSDWMCAGAGNDRRCALQALRVPPGYSDLCMIRIGIFSSVAVIPGPWSPGDPWPFFVAFCHFNNFTPLF